jgi:hypothetical protein
LEQSFRGMTLDGLIVNRYPKRRITMAINEEIFNPIEKKKKVQHYTCTDIISDINPEAKFADGFDEAIIGYDAVGFRVVYDYDKCSEILMKRDGGTKHDAHEHMEFNVVGAYVGEFTPIFVHRLD